jgi:hypothetical protein
MANINQLLFITEEVASDSQPINWLETIIRRDVFGDVVNSTVTFFIVILAALVMGIAVSMLYKSAIKKGAVASANLAVALVILPVVITAVIFVVGSSVASAFALAGIFAMTRFRSAAANAKDLTFVFVAVALGVSCGRGYVFYGLVITVVLCAVLLILSSISYGEPKTLPKVLRINVPESLSFTGMFDEILKKYAVDWQIMRMKTVDLGATYEISFAIITKENIDEKAFIDELRCLNGNMNIILMLDKRRDGSGQV